MEFEFAFLNFIQNHLRCEVLDIFFSTITHLGDAGILWIVTGLVLLIPKKSRKSGVAILAGLVLDLLLCNILLKPLVARTRPFDINTAVNLLIAKPGDYSFPSGHTAASFTTMFALLFSRERKLWPTVLALAILIAFSRMYLYVHYPTDVLAGVLIGLVCGYLGVKIVAHLRSSV